MNIFLPAKRNLKPYNGLDILKMAAIICVILNHTLPKKGFLISFLYHYVIYMAVPVFMVISGFLLSYAWEKHHFTTVWSYFRPKSFLKRLAHYAFPFFIIILGECCFRHHITFDFILNTLKTGGVGKGAYYIPVFFQFLLLFPFLYKLSSFPRIGTLIILLITIVFEKSFIMYIKAGDIYRLMFFRYLLICWGGILLYRYQIKISLILKLCVLSLIYVTFVFCNIQVPLVYSWKATSWMTAGYAWFIVWLFLKIKTVPAIPRWINIGRQTWFIFLFQMCYLHFLVNKMPVFWKPVWSFHAVMCLTGGVLFFYAYQLLTRIVKKSYMWCYHKF